MSLGDSRIPESEAKKEAEIVLRKQVGNIPHLGSAEYIEDTQEYVFPIMVSLPNILFEEGETQPEAVGVRFMPEMEVGEIRVDGKDGSINDRTNTREINQRISDKEYEIEIAVQKALIKASAKRFSRLPYTTHRYTPIIDILSEVILSGKIDASRFVTFGDDEREKYDEHLQTLIDVNLVDRENNNIRPSKELVSIQTGQSPNSDDTDTTERPLKGKKPSKVLNESMAFLLEQRIDDIETLHEILGPHLKIAGYYYRRAIEIDGLPKLTKNEIKNHFSGKYQGERGRLKLFKLSRYLLQLEEVGLIKSQVHLGERVWVGDSDIKSAVEDQEEHLEPVFQIRA